MLARLALGTAAVIGAVLAVPSATANHSPVTLTANNESGRTVVVTPGTTVVIRPEFSGRVPANGRLLIRRQRRVGGKLTGKVTRAPCRLGAQTCSWRQRSKSQAIWAYQASIALGDGTVPFISHVTNVYWRKVTQDSPPKNPGSLGNWFSGSWKTILDVTRGNERPVRRYGAMHVCQKSPSYVQADFEWDSSGTLAGPIMDAAGTLWRGQLRASDHSGTTFDFYMQPNRRLMRGYIKGIQGGIRYGASIEATYHSVNRLC